MDARTFLKEMMLEFQLMCTLSLMVYLQFFKVGDKLVSFKSYGDPLDLFISRQLWYLQYYHVFVQYLSEILLSCICCGKRQ